MGYVKQWWFHTNGHLSVTIALSLPLLRRKGRENTMEKAHVEIKTGGSLTNYCHWPELSLICHGAAAGLCSQRLLIQPPCYQTLVMCTYKHVSHRISPGRKDLLPLPRCLLCWGSKMWMEKTPRNFRTFASAQWDVEGSFAVSCNAYIWALSPPSTACCHLFMLVLCPCSKIQPPLAPRLIPSLAGVVSFPNAFSSGRLQSTAAFCVLPDIVIFIISQKDLSSVLCSGFPCFFTALG